MTPAPVFDLPVPRSATALMQQLQLLVGKEAHRFWCGGKMPPEKFKAFALKMANRYPGICRTSRQRSYDRKRGRAAMHFIAFAEEGVVWWWLLSDSGEGGLADPRTEDYRVARDAMRADGHIEWGDYVLLYATKKEPRVVTDARTRKAKTIVKDVSTWTWKLRRSVVTELRAAVEEHCRRAEYGAEGAAGARPWGLRGLLWAQRQRPLFSGVRNQVIELHRYARDSWESVRPRWRAMHTDIVARYGDKAGALRPLKEVTSAHLPKMPRLPVYDASPTRMRDLIAPPAPHSKSPTSIARAA